MSAPSESAISPSPCACTNISLMQLFHELKQKYPGVPDHVVSNTIELYCHDKQACETHLHREVKASLTHAYHASSSAAARQLNESRINLPTKCRNQPIVKHEAPKFTSINSVKCPLPLTAVLNKDSPVNEDNIELNTDANQNVVEAKNEEIIELINNVPNSPVTIVNIDNCCAKYNAESPSDLESTNDNIQLEKVTTQQVNEDSGKVENNEQPESTNYKILKSNKIKSNLNERLELGKNKPVRPSTLDFVKPIPDIAFKQTLNKPETETCRTVSPAPSQKYEHEQVKDTVGNSFRPDRGYPLNLSVNVNCHMDYNRPYGDPWLDDYDSPRTITSVNLTVCTPTSNMASPVRESRKEDSGFEGHVTVTVSPSTTRAPRRPAPPPPMQTSRIEPTRPSRPAPEPPEQQVDRSLIERQKERLGCLSRAVAQEKSRLAQLARETRILAAPPPSPAAMQHLREYVERLRDQCNTMAKRLEMTGNDREESPNFYSNIYTGQRPSDSWECHLCTFKNHPLLDKCEQCDMPRIVVGTSLTRNHDSGFGSFRDRSKRLNSQIDLDLPDSGTAMSNIIEDCRSRLNC